MIHGRTRWTSGAAGAMLLAASLATAGEIRIFSTATVQADAVTLGDIAAIRGLDSDTTGRLAALVVHAAPMHGGELLVRTEAVRAALVDAEISLLDAPIVGATRCKVARPAAARPAQATSLLKARPSPAGDASVHPASGDVAVIQPQEGTLESYIRQYIAARAGEPAERLEIRFSPSCRRALDLPSAAHRFDVRAAESSERKLGLVSFRVGVFQGDRRVESAAIVAEVLVTREVVVARSPINRGQAITGRHLKLEARKFDDAKKIGLTDLAAAIGQEASDMIKAGDMLTGGSLRARPAVRRGEAVTIWRRGDSLMIKTTGKAQADGMLGETIKVRRDGSKLSRELIDVIVTGPGTVEVADSTQVVASR